MATYHTKVPNVVSDKGKGLRILNRRYRILVQAAHEVAIKVVIRARA